MRTFRWTLWATLLAFSGCQFHSEFGPSVIISCETSDVCPTNHRCDQTLALCVATASSLSSSSVFPEAARLGDTVTVTAAATIQDSRTPTVWLIDAKRARFPLLVNQNGLQLSAARQLTGEEAEGVAELFVNVPEPGRGLSLVSLGQVRIDFTPPALTSATTTLVGAATNPLIAYQHPALLTKVTDGTTVTLAVTASEPLLERPLVVAQSDAGFLVVTDDPSAEGHFTLSLSPTSGDGTYLITTRFTDLVGNVSNPVAGTVEVKRSKPDALTDAPGGVVFRRAPNGTIESPWPHVSFRAAAGSANGAQLVIFRAADVPGQAAVVSADGGVMETRYATSADPDTVSVLAVDSAGNLSDEITVRDIEWVARGGLEADGGQLLLGQGFGSRSLGPRPSPDGSLQLGSTTGSDFEESVSYRGPPRVIAGPATTCLTRGMNGLVGNASAVERLAQTVACTPSTALVYDWVRKVAVVIAPTPSDPVMPTSPSPPLGSTPLGYRLGASFGWAPSLGGVIAVGGRSPAGQILAETWLLDAQGWHKLAIETPSIAYSSLALEPASDRPLLIGGEGPDGGALGTVWALNDGGWQQLPAYALPPARRRAAASDPAHTVLLVSGGQGVSGDLAETWRATPQGWASVPQGDLPGGTLGAGLTWDGRANTFVANTVEFHQPDASTNTGSWQLLDAGWVSLTPASAGALGGPPTVVDQTMGRLLRVGEVVVVSQSGDSCTDNLGYWQTSEQSFEGLRWQTLDAGVFGGDGGLIYWSPDCGNGFPGPAYGYDFTHHTLVAAFGYQTASLYELSGDDWVPSALPPLPNRLGGSLAWDAEADQWLFNQGTSAWALRRGDWVPSDPVSGFLVSGPEVAGVFSVGVDGVKRRLGGSWSTVSTSIISNPLVTSRGLVGIKTIVTNPSVWQRVVFGPDGEHVTTADTSLFRYFWVSKEQRLYGFRGDGSLTAFDAAGALSNQVWALPLANARTPAGASWEAIGVRATGAARGWSAAGAPVDGLQLVVFDGTARVPVDQTSASNQTAWATFAKAEIDRLTRGEAAFVFALQPQAPAAIEPTVVRTDQVEVTLIWRRP